MKLLLLLSTKKIIYFGLTCLFILSIYQGFKLSLYNQDYHHSFFILSMYLDSLNEFSLFKDIFLQYGPGQLVLYRLIDKLIDINIVTIYKINAIIYAFNLAILFKIFKKISTIKIAFSAIFLIFLIHPYSIYPWPDYISGICLSIFYYFFLKKEKKITILTCSVFLFLAIFFRSTYIINISFGIFIYFLIFFWIKKKNQLSKISLVLTSLLITYFYTLYYYGNFYLWFSESISFITNYAEDTKHTELYTKIVNVIGHKGFIFLKILYYLLRSTINLLNVSNIQNLFFVLVILINLFFIRNFFKNKNFLNQFENKFFFISILGLSGFVQSLMLMEVFRNINATIGIVITAVYLFGKNSHILNSKYNKAIFASIFIYIIFLIKNFPLIKVNDNNYAIYKNIYFSNSKQVELEIKSYYEEVENYLCGLNKISLINLTQDYALNYLCNHKFIKNKSSYSVIFLKQIKPDEYERIVINTNLKKNEILVSYEKLLNDNIQLIKKFTSPHKNQNLYGDKIYLYKKNI